MAPNPTEKSSVAALEWGEFIANSAPGKMLAVLNGCENFQGRWIVAHPAIRLYCDSESCKGEHYFDPKGSTTFVSNAANFFLHYVCRHCRTTTKTYALYLRRDEKGAECSAFKYGEFPVFGPHIPTRLISLIGPDKDYFFKGRQAESAGLGIAAFAYYRRVVENQKARIIDEILRVFDRVGGSPEKRALLVHAKAETQFAKAVDLIKEAIPESLKINGHSPLTLLHSALSEGIHELTDEECLDRAHSIRLILSELTERIRNAMLDSKELNDALTKLLNKGKGRGAGAQSNP